MKSGTWIYEVEAAINVEVVESYLEWLLPHAADVVTAGGFLGFQVLRDDSKSNVIVSRYFAKSKSDIEAYIAGPAAALRADAQNRFGGRFQAQRRIFQVLDSSL